MTTREKICALLDNYKTEVINLNSWELDFLETLNDRIDDNFSEKQIEKVDEIWDKKYD